MRRKTKKRFPYFMLLEVIGPHDHSDTSLEDLKETEMLVNTYGGVVVDKAVQHRDNPHPSTYIGGGLLEQVKQTVVEKDIDVLVMNGILDAGQLYRLEKYFWDLNKKTQVWDRVDLILHIFKKNAHTVEAKLQIELAELQHTGPRVYGLGKHRLSRQAGGIGTRGVGETNIELEKRQIQDRVKKIEEELKKRTLMREKRIRRRRNSGLKSAALVGYTSAGKTTLFNELTNRKKKARKSLFTTLDSVVGRVYVPEIEQVILVSDTIGFIQDLPPMLIEAFKSTLMESVAADVLLQVVDVGDEKLEEKVDVVNTILADLGVKQRAVLVFNKLDTIDGKRRRELAKYYSDTPHYFISAKTGEGVEKLRSELGSKLIPNKKAASDKDFVLSA